MCDSGQGTVKENPTLFLYDPLTPITHPLFLCYHHAIKRNKILMEQEDTRASRTARPAGVFQQGKT